MSLTAAEQALAPCHMPGCLIDEHVTDAEAGVAACRAAFDSSGDR